MGLGQSPGVAAFAIVGAGLRPVRLVLRARRAGLKPAPTAEKNAAGNIGDPSFSHCYCGAVYLEAHIFMDIEPMYPIRYTPSLHTPALTWWREVRRLCGDCRRAGAERWRGWWR